MPLRNQIFLLFSLFFLFILWLFTGIFDQLPQATISSKGKRRYLGPKNYFTAKNKEEIITFFSRENATSNKMIARRARIVRKRGAKALVFIFHGFMCDKEDVQFLNTTLFSESEIKFPVSTVSIDFRAHGEIPDGQCCSLGCNEVYDVMGIVDFIRNDPVLSKLKRVVYGFSMGAVASILAQSKDPSLFDAAIWDCPFESTEKVLERTLGRLKLSVLGHDFDLPGKSIFQKYIYNDFIQSFLKAGLKTIANVDTQKVNTCILPVNTTDAMNKITIPILLIGCKNDEKIPVSGFHEIFDAAKGHKKLWITNGRRHFDSFFYNPEKYTREVAEFLKKITGRSFKKNKITSNIVEDELE